MCAKFDGVNDGLRLANGINWLNGKAGCCLAAWVQRQGAGAVGFNQEFMFLSRPTLAQPRVEFEWDQASTKTAAYAQAPDTAAFQLGQSAAGVLPLDTGTPGTWVHVCVNVDVGGDRFYWYINGVLSTTTIVAFTGATFTASALGDWNSIGFQTDGVLKFDFLQGTLADLRLYERLLLAEEIKCMATMRGHDGIRGNLALKFDFRGRDAVALSTANVLNSAPLPQAITTFATLESVPVFARDTIALRRRT